MVNAIHADFQVKVTSRLGSALREAIVTMLAVLATFICTMAIAPEPGPGVLAVVLSLSFARSHLDRDLRGRLEAAVALPLVGLTAVGAGMLLHRAPWIGAAAFVLGMFVSIWLRRFGPMAGRMGSLIALPFVAILTTPYIPPHHLSPAMIPAAPVIVGLLALAWVATLQAAARRIGLLPQLRKQPVVTPEPPPPETARGPRASTRMAIQMAAALSIAFVVGYLFFPQRWAWIVLTAFIVNSGNRGRLDVAYKSVLRVLGAAAGTVIALTVTVHIGAHDSFTVACMLAAVFLGLWLRPMAYAWWALFVTIALALLQGFNGTNGDSLLWTRLEEILIGALIGVLCAWLVYPVRSTGVLRRRIANALAALSDALSAAPSERQTTTFIATLDQVEQVAPPFRASRRALQRLRPNHPADWIDTLLACRIPALALIEGGEAPGHVRKALGAARKALREPENLLPALQQLRQTLVTPAAASGDAAATSEET